MSLFIDAIKPDALAEQVRLYDKSLWREDLPMFFSSLFTDRRTEMLKIEFWKGYRQGSRLAPLAKLDANYSRIPVPGVAQIVGEIPFTRFGFGLTEEEQDQLTAAANSRNNQILIDLLRDIYDRRARGVKDIRGLKEYMCAQLVQSNSFTINSVDYDGLEVSFALGYDIPGEPTWASEHIIHKVDPWETAASDPIKDIIEAVEEIREFNGTVITRIAPSKRLYKAMLTNDNVRNYFVSPLFQNLTITKGSVEDYLRVTLGGNMTIINPFEYNDSILGFDDVTRVNFLQDDRVIMLSNNKVGEVRHAITPAERAKRENPRIDLAIVDTRTAIHSNVKETEPFSYETVLSARFAPTGEGMDSVFNLSVVAP